MKHSCSFEWEFLVGWLVAEIGYCLIDVCDFIASVDFGFSIGGNKSEGWKVISKLMILSWTSYLLMVVSNMWAVTSPWDMASAYKIA